MQTNKVLANCECKENDFDGTELNIDLTKIMDIFKQDFWVKTPHKWIRSCHKDLKMHKNKPKANVNPQNPNPTPKTKFSGYFPNKDQIET